MVKTKIRDSVLKNIIPLSLCIAIIVICMYNYGRQYMPLYFCIAAVFQTAVFVFFDYLSTKSVLLRFVSILGSFFAMCAMVILSIKLGYNTNSIQFFVWFLSPQALVDFSASYIIAIFIIMNFFISSTVYYFSVVRYRISMSFLITLIPFAFYRKEGEQIPVIFAMILLILYVALMIHCRHQQAKVHQKVYLDKGYKKSVFFFLAFAILIAVICPKPQFQASNNFVNSLLDNEKFSDYMLRQLGLVSDTSYVSDIYTKPSNKELFSFMTEETPINLKSQTYSKYDYKKNIWKTKDSDVHGTAFDSDYYRSSDPQLFYEAVAYASKDSKFADKYDLHDMNPQLDGDYHREIKLLNSVVSTKYCLVPTNTYQINLDSDLYITPNGMVFKSAQSASAYSAEYFSPAIQNDPGYRKILDRLNDDNYSDFIDDVYEALGNQGEEILNKYADTLTNYYNENINAYDYLGDVSMTIPQTITDIAKEITDGYDSVYEKAEALEIYFVSNGFKYDLSYKKPDDYNMEYFLTEGKTGICTDYATAMVLLARSAGIPARYAEGVAVLESDPDTNIAYVTDAQLHAFPELFIPGYGWRTFEPTQVEQNEKTYGYNYVLSAVVIVSIVLLALLYIVFIKFMYPVLYVAAVKFKVSRSGFKKAAAIIMHETGKCIKASPSMTSEEIRSEINKRYNYDISVLTDTFECAVYSGTTQTDENIKEAVRIYEELRKVIKQYEAQQKEEKRKNRKRVRK